MKAAHTAIPIGDCLSDVGAGQSASAPRAPEAKRIRKGDGPNGGIAAQIAEAHARGLAEGRAAAEAILLDRLEHQKRLAAETLATERRAWNEVEAKKIASTLEDGLRAVEKSLADQIARILGPLLTDLKRDQAASELMAAVGAILPGSRDLTLEMSGPADLSAAVSKAVDGRTAKVVTTISEATEMTLTAGHTVLETRFNSWARLIERAVA